MAMTTNPMVNLSTLRIQPDRPTNVTMPKLKMAIQMIDIVKEAKKYLRLCASLQAGMVQVNKQMNGKLSMNNTQPRKNLNGARTPPSSGYSGNSADTAGKQGQGLIFSCSSSFSFTSAMDSMSTLVSSSSTCTVWAFPLASTRTTATDGKCAISDRRLAYSFIKCICATDLSLSPSPGVRNPIELLWCALGS